MLNDTMTLLDQIEQEIFDLECEKESYVITASQESRLAILSLCFDLLTRTSSGPINNLDSYHIEFRHKVSNFIDNPLADFAYAMATKQGNIQMRDLLSSFLSKERWGPQYLTQQKIAHKAGLRQATISDYTTGKVSMTVTNYEKVINATIKLIQEE